MATKTPSEVCLALLEDVRHTFDTLEQALRYVAAETKRTYSVPCGRRTTARVADARSGMGSTS